MNNMKNDVKYITGYFDDEEQMLNAIKELRDKGHKIYDALTPFPVHGLDHAIGLKASGIPTVGFIAGLVGAVGAFALQAWVFTVAYPMYIGGKPLLAVPSFIPVIFESTVLFAAIAMVFAFLFRSKLGAGAENKIWDTCITDDHFVLLMDASAYDDLVQAGAMEVKHHDNN